MKRLLAKNRILLLVALAVIVGYLPFRYISAKDSTILPSYVLLLTLIAVIIYTLETRRLRQLSEIQARPYIFVSLQPVESAPSLLNLVVQNIGPRPAYDLRFDLKRDAILPTNKSMSEVNFIKNGLKCLAPDHRTQFLFFNLFGSELEKIQATEITVVYGRYKDDSAPISETFTLDPAEFWGRPRVNEERNSEIVKSLDSIHKDLVRIASKIPDPFLDVFKKKDEGPPNPEGE